MVTSMFGNIGNWMKLFCVAVIAVLATTSYHSFLAEEPTEDSKSKVIGWEDARLSIADWGEIRNYFVGNTHSTENVLVAVAIVDPGKATHKAHRHAEEEYLAIVEGTGTWMLDGEEFPAKRGDILYAEPWIYHGLTNTGKEPLIFLVIKYSGKGIPVPNRPDDRPDELD